LKGKFGSNRHTQAGFSVAVTARGGYQQPVSGANSIRPRLLAKIPLPSAGVRGWESTRHRVKSALKSLKLF